MFIFIAAFLYSRSWKNALFIEPLHKINTEDKVVALTFDDGPSLSRTPPLLELLEKHNVKATFFMLGENIERHPEIAKQVFDNGHLIGNHSFDHPRMYFRSPKYIKEQIQKTDKLIQNLGQSEVKYFRPPHSAKFIVLPLVLLSIDKLLVTGSYDPPAEYMHPYDGKIVSNQIIDNVMPGSIIYLHDGKDTDVDEFLKSVELTIIGLKERGYTFVTLDYKI